jgi:hypothetical protein
MPFPCTSAFNPKAVILELPANVTDGPRADFRLFAKQERFSHQARLLFASDSG